MYFSDLCLSAFICGLFYLYLAALPSSWENNRVLAVLPSILSHRRSLTITTFGSSLQITFYGQFGIADWRRYSHLRNGHATHTRATRKGTLGVFPNYGV